MIELQDANKVMEKFNHTFEIIKNKMYEYDTKRMHNKEAHLIYEGLNFSYLEMCKLMEELENVLLSSDSATQDLN